MSNYHLILVVKEISSLLVEFIRSLPNLDSLIIRSFVILQPQCLSSEEKTALRYISTNNNITKVNLQQLTKLGQIEFLIDLCLRLQHLKVTCSDNIDPESVLRFILMEKVRYITYN